MFWRLLFKENEVCVAVLKIGSFTANFPRSKLALLFSGLDITMRLAALVDQTPNEPHQCPAKLQQVHGQERRYNGDRSHLN